MRETVIYTIFMLATLMVAATPAHAQAWMNQWSGVPCSYNYQAQNCGVIGCWGDGWCTNSKVMHVEMDQWWACSPGNSVLAIGSSGVVYNGGPQHPTGLQAVASSTVFMPGQREYYSGWENDDCNGSLSYSGGYDYFC